MFSQTKTAGRFQIAARFSDSWNVPWLEAPSPKERDRDAAGAERLGGQRRAGGKRQSAADDPVRAEHALVDIGDVHRAALALADAGGLAHQLRDHAVDIDTLGDAMTVAAVRAGDVVAIGEVTADADRDRFLAGVEVDESGNQTVGEVLPGRSSKMRIWTMRSYISSSRAASIGAIAWEVSMAMPSSWASGTADLSGIGDVPADWFGCCALIREIA